MAKEKIEASLFADYFKNLGKSLLQGDSLGKGIDRSIGSVKSPKDDELVGTLWPEDEDLQPYLFKLDNLKQINETDTKMNLSFQDPSGQIYPNVMQVIFTTDEDKAKKSNQSLVDGAAIANMDEWANMVQKFEDRVMIGFPIAASLKLTLERICGSTEDTVNLSNVFANYSYSCANQDIDCLLDSPDFIDQIPDNTETRYLITYKDDEYDISELTEEYSSPSCMDQIFILFVKFYNNVRYLYWTERDLNYKAYLEALIWDIQTQQDKLAELLLSTGCCIPEVNYADLTVGQNTLGTETLSQYITKFISELEFCSLNADDMCIELLDNIISYWKTKIVTIDG